MRDLIRLDLRCIDEEDWHEAACVKLEPFGTMETNEAHGHEQCIQREPNVYIETLYNDEAIVVQAPNSRDRGLQCPGRGGRGQKENDDRTLRACWFHGTDTKAIDAAIKMEAQDANGPTRSGKQ